MNRNLSFKKGDKVCMKVNRMSNLARHMPIFSLENINQWTTPGEVVSVSKKYITVSTGRQSTMKFVIEDDYNEKVSCGGSNWKLYNSLEDIIEEKQKEITFRNIENKLYEKNLPNISLETLTKIDELLK